MDTSNISSESSEAKYTKTSIVDAVCKNNIASVRVMFDGPLANVDKVHRAGDKKFLFFKYKEDIIVYKGKKFTFNELCKYLGPIALYISSDDKVYYAPQVIIHYQDAPYHGFLECKHFKTNIEAAHFFDKLVNENSLKVL